MAKNGLPFSNGCYVCGQKNSLGLKIKFHTDSQKVITEFTPTEEHQGYKGIVHGGILCTLLDEAMGWSPTVLTGRMTVTAEISFRFIKSAPTGEKLIVTAKAEEIHRRLYTASGQITGEDGTVYVTGTGKFIPLSEQETKDVDSWLVYDENTLKIFEK